MAVVAVAIRVAISLVGFMPFLYPAIGFETAGSPGTQDAVRVLDRGLDSPGGMLLGGNELFVSNGYGGYANDGSVTELDLLTGRVVKTISGPSRQV